MTHQLKTIAVDLTPVLPGGENGGAKLFVIELLRHLAVLAPQTQFVLFTQAAAHEELAYLDRPNMRRLMIIGSTAAQPLRSRLKDFLRRLMALLPSRLRTIINGLSYRLNAKLQHAGSDALMRDIGADLLFCPFTAPTYVQPGIPAVCTLYDLQYKTYPEFFTPEEAAHRERVFVDTCRRATAIAAISDYSRESALAHGGLDPARIRTIHLRMAQRMAYEADSTSSRVNRFGLVEHRYLIYPANFWRHKNHELLLIAFSVACHGGLPADIRLVCTGAPTARQALLIKAAGAMGLGDRVSFPGYLPNQELAALLAKSAGMVFPSLYEGFGLPVIEAMAAGIPVACSDTTSLPEVAAGAAILFNPRVPTQIAEAMITLAGGGVTCTQLVQAGYRRAQEFSDSERMAREYWELFQYALSHARQDTLLTGAYPDGWAGPMLQIQVAPGRQMQTIVLDVTAPDWLPCPALTMRAIQGGKTYGEPIEISRGGTRQWSLPVGPEGGCYEVYISPTFIPAQVGHGSDQRELSLLLRCCTIVQSEGGQMQLFPEQVSA